MKKNVRKRRRIRPAVIFWFILVAASIAFYLILSNFIVFPDKYKLPFIVLLLAIDMLMGLFVFHRPKKKHIFTSIINIVLSAAMIAACVYVPYLEGKMENIFVSTDSTTSTVTVNCYVMTADYKSAHTDVFTDTTTSENLSDYVSSTFITQSAVDQDTQTAAIEDIQNELGVDTLNTLSQTDIASAVQSLYNNEGQVLIMNSSFEETISEISGFENFTSETEVIYTATVALQTETAEATPTTNADGSFAIYLAGEDTRSSELSTYGRTDVNMILVVNPSTHQILQVSIPRDYYINNPALGGLDKLTHLGNSGIENTLAGVNEEFGLDIGYYMVVNFSTFYNIIEAIGGIDIDNPYEFTTSGSNGSAVQSGSTTIGGSYTFPEGTIHLDGDMALSYVRERYNLQNGDYDRNEHQSIVIKGIIDKLTSSEILTHYQDVLTALQGQFLTNLSSDTIYSLAEEQLDSGESYEMIRYHLGGTGTYAGTVSMGWSTQLYVVEPIDSQVQFVNEQVNKVLNGETISQETLPE